MALGEPFKNQFKPGDVVYGLSKARIPYINSLGEDLAHMLRAWGKYLICDELNNRSFGKVPKWDSSLEDPSTKQQIKANLAHHKKVKSTPEYPYPMSPAGQKAAKEYYNALKGSKYAPLKAVKISVAQAAEKGNSNLQDLLFRRACKFGMDYVIRQQKGTVHFVLDIPEGPNGQLSGNIIDSLDVVEKRHHSGHVPITTSELRCCFRNRGDWIPSGRLKFYSNLLEVNPPWVDHPDIWSEYTAHRMKKGRI